MKWVIFGTYYFAYKQSTWNQVQHIACRLNISKNEEKITRNGGWHQMTNFQLYISLVLEELQIWDKDCQEGA